MNRNSKIKEAKKQIFSVMYENYNDGMKPFGLMEICLPALLLSISLMEFDNEKDFEEFLEGMLKNIGTSIRRGRGAAQSFTDAKEFMMDQHESHFGKYPDV